MEPLFSPREVATLSNVPVRSVHRAVEDKVFVGLPRDKQGRRRKLPLYAVAYAAIIAHLPFVLSLAQKRDIGLLLSKRSVDRMTSDPLPIGPAVSVDLAQLIGRDVAACAYRYGCVRDAAIEFDAKILDGPPKLRGTDLTVYGLAGRLSHGEEAEAIKLDFPHLTLEVIEVAAFYARTHPVLGRPVDGDLADAD